MRRLTPDERIVLREVGEPGEFASWAAFESAEREGWGTWGPDGWRVTESGRRTLELDLLADSA